MGTQGTGRKRSTKKERSTAEDDALNLIAREAEARLAAKRAARAEAREIRMKELERQQKELSDDDERMSVGSRGSARVEDRDYLEKGSRAASALTAATLTSLGGTSSRRGSGETAITVDAETSIREIKEIHELKDQIQDVETKYTQNLKEVKDALAEVEEKYRKAMVSNAQLDNEKNNLMYQVDTLKDSLMELEELLSESRREYEEKVKENEREKHAHSVLQFQFNEMKETLKQSEELLNDIRQLRMKQDGFVREISDLQETVEWKDKKIGALERQKEYTDAIRTERDELREEVVKLKDILKKHGIVLGPDLNINGDIGEAEVDGSPSGDSASQPAQDSQTSPAEGNSMLGNTEETQLRSSREDEVDPEQHQEILKEEAKENQLSLDTLCSAADVSALETSGEEQPTEQQQTCLSTEEDRSGESSLSKDLDVDVNDGPITDAKDKIVCSSELKVIVTSAEDNIPETETPEVRDLGETSNPDLEETETKTSSDDFRETCNKFSEEQENKQEDADESKLSNTESCPQQKAAKDVIEENLPHGTNLAVSNSEPQQEPENAEEAENGEAEEISSKSQGATASGKKKKKKRRGKKKGGNQQKDSTEKEHSKTEEDIESAKRDNGSTEEPAVDNSVTETLKESKTDQVKNEQDSHKTKEVDAAKAVETFAHKEALKEPRMDPVTNEHDKKQMDLETETEEELKVVAPTETLSHIETPMEIRVDHVTNEPSKDQSLERETVEKVEAVATAETFSHVETLKELTTEPTEDEQNKEQTLEGEKVEKVDSITNPPEASLSAFDLIDTSNNTGSTDDLDKECTCIVDNSVSGDISTNGEVIHSESEIIDHVEDEAGPVNEMKPECTATNPENSLQTNIEENTEAESNVPSNGDIAADESESTNDPERKDLPPYTDDFTEVKSSSVSEPELETESKPISEPVSELSVTSDGAPSEVSDRGPKDATETITDVEEPEVETEQEYLPPSVVSPSHDGGNSELEQEGTQKEELSRDSKEPEDLVEPDSSSHDEKIDSASSLTKNTDASDAEKSPMETVAQVELLDDGESQTLECVEQSNESNTKVSSETDETNITDVLNTPDSPKEATEIGISIEQDHSTEVSAVEDLEYEMSQNEQESDTSLCPLAEQLHESSKDKPKDDSSQPTKEDSDEEDAEDEEGQSFDFDDMDIEAAVGTNSPQNQEQEDVEEGVEVMSNESNKGGSDPCQSNTETNENTQNKPIESNDEKRSVDEGDQVDTLDKKSDTVPQDNQNSLAHEESTADGTRHITEEGKVLNVGESGVAENINQATSLLVEEGLDAIEHSDNLVLPKSGDQVASNKETPQTGKEVKKNGRKGKGKGKEECKMS